MSIRRRALFALATSERFESAARWAVPGRTRAAASRYVAGDTVAEALAVARRLTADGFAVSLDAFGERERDPAAIETVIGGYEALAAGRRLGARGRVGLRRPLPRRARARRRVRDDGAAADR